MMTGCLITNIAMIFYVCNHFKIRPEQTVIGCIMPPSIHFNKL